LSVVLTIFGAIVIVAGLQDIFHNLFHPVARAAISDWLEVRIWHFFQKVANKGLDFAGPIAFVLIVIYWASSMVLGFALIYRPWIPSAFTFASGLQPERYASMAGALNVSLSSLAGTSSGVYSTSLWLQFLIGLEAVFGFAVLTASISWILSIYRVLEHRRSLAQEATLLKSAQERGMQRLDNLSDSELEQILLGLTSQLITHRNELTQFSITYYFHEKEEATSLVIILPFLSDLADKSRQRAGSAGIAALILGGAIDDYLKLIATRFLNRTFRDREEALRAFAEDHRWTIARSAFIVTGRAPFKLQPSNRK
jgi:hypothetical protein